MSIVNTIASVSLWYITGSLLRITIINAFSDSSQNELSGTHYHNECRPSGGGDYLHMSACSICASSLW